MCVVASSLQWAESLNLRSDDDLTEDPGASKPDDDHALCTSGPRAPARSETAESYGAYGKQEGVRKSLIVIANLGYEISSQFHGGLAVFCLKGLLCRAQDLNSPIEIF